MALGHPPPFQADIQDALLKRFLLAAVSPKGLFDYPTGRDGLRALSYPDEFINSLSERVAECYCGVGNPFAPGLPASGAHVLDVGCGAGVDTLLAARCVGFKGRVDGLELSPDMLGRARENVRHAGLDTVHLRQGGAESLPYADASFDCIISNGVYNLVQDKPRALAEAFRVLKPGGRLQVADQILESDAPQVCPLPQPGAPSSAGAWAK